MKGVMGFLEKAGLVRMDTSHDSVEPTTVPSPATPHPYEDALTVYEVDASQLSAGKFIAAQQALWAKVIKERNITTG